MYVKPIAASDAQCKPIRRRTHEAAWQLLLFHLWLHLPTHESRHGRHTSQMDPKDALILKLRKRLEAAMGHNQRLREQLQLAGIPVPDGSPGLGRMTPVSSSTYAPDEVGMGGDSLSRGSDSIPVTPPRDVSGQTGTGTETFELPRVRSARDAAASRASRGSAHSARSTPNGSIPSRRSRGPASAGRVRPPAVRASSFSNEAGGAGDYSPQPGHAVPQAPTRSGTPHTPQSSERAIRARDEEIDHLRAQLRGVGALQQAVHQLQRDAASASRHAQTLQRENTDLREQLAQASASDGGMSAEEASMLRNAASQATEQAARLKEALRKVLQDNDELRAHATERQPSESAAAGIATGALTREQAAELERLQAERHDTEAAMQELHKSNAVLSQRLEAMQNREMELLLALVSSRMMEFARVKVANVAGL